MKLKRIFRGLMYTAALTLASLSFNNPLNSYVNSFFSNRNIVSESMILKQDKIDDKKDKEDTMKKSKSLEDIVVKEKNLFYSPFDSATFSINVVRRIKNGNTIFHFYSKDPDLKRLETTVDNLNENNILKENYFDLCNFKGLKRSFSDKSLSELIKEYSSNFNVDENIIYAIVNNESLGYLNNDSKVAVAPLHVTFDTYNTLKRKYNFKDKNLCDVEDNVFLGVLYIKGIYDVVENIVKKNSFESFPLRLVFASYYAGKGVIYNFMDYYSSNFKSVVSSEKIDDIAKEYLENFYSKNVNVYADRALNAYAAFKNGNYKQRFVDITNKLLEHHD